MDRMTYTLGYRMADSAYENKVRIHAESVENAFEIFYATWERDGSDRAELSDVWNCNETWIRE
jgi:hypothetical protein